MRDKVFIIVVLALLVAFLAPQYHAWSQAQGVIPPGVTLAGHAINGSTLDQVEEQLIALFMTPVAVYYQDRRLILWPQEIGFQVRTRVMVNEARRIGNVLYMTRAFLFYLLGRTPPPRDIPLIISWDPQRLDAWLTQVAERFDRPPQPPRARTESFTWQPGAAGWVLDKEASVPRIITALKQVGDRRVAKLVVREGPAPPPPLDELQRMLQARVDAFPGVASVFVRHLETGEEVNINGSDVPYSGMSVMKIPILLAVYGELDTLPTGELRSWMTETITSTTGAGNYTANRVLHFLGQGDPLRGARKVTQLLWDLGLKNSYIVAPYDWRGPHPEVVRTPANQRPRFYTLPDPYIQATAEDMGVLMGMVVNCARGRGTLLAAFPERFTPEECQDLLKILALNPVTSALLPAGLPPGTRYVHKHGYASDTHGDVSAVWGPDGVYVISVFLSSPGEWLVWDLSNSTFIDLSRLTWEYFALRAAPASPAATAPITPSSP